VFSAPPPPDAAEARRRSVAEATALACGTTALVLRASGDAASGGALLPPQAAAVPRREADAVVGRLTRRLAWPQVRLLFIGAREEMEEGEGEGEGGGVGLVGGARERRGSLLSRLDGELVRMIAGLVTEETTDMGRPSAARRRASLGGAPLAPPIL